MGRIHRKGQPLAADLGGSAVIGGFGAILAAALYAESGAVVWVWNVCLILLGTLALGLREERPEGLPAGLRYALGAWLALVVLQLVPLPQSALELLSPRRAEWLAALADVSGDPQRAAPLSLAPAATSAHLFRVAAYVCAFLLAVRCRSKRPDSWLPGAVLIVLAVVEAGLGAAQRLVDPTVPAHGTFVNRNHFAGFLALALPFAVMAPFAASMRRRSHTGVGVAAVLAALLIAAGLGLSLSRGGFLAASVSLAAMAVAAVAVWMPAGRCWRSWAAGAACCGAVVAASLIWMPSGLVVRFQGVPAGGELSMEGRVRLWVETLDLIRDYPVLGCGLGAYGSAFQRYKGSAPARADPYAHNDYLQITAETGLAGALAAAAIVGLILRRLGRNLRLSRAPAERCLLLACLGALAAAAVHALFDFNLYLPAYGLATAWTAGVASARKRETIHLIDIATISTLKAQEVSN